MRPSPAKKAQSRNFCFRHCRSSSRNPARDHGFAVRFGTSTFGIIDAFPDEAARETHLGGPVGKALAEKADELFAAPPDISNLDVIANKL